MNRQRQSISKNVEFSIEPLFKALNNRGSNSFPDTVVSIGSHKLVPLVFTCFLTNLYIKFIVFGVMLRCINDIRKSSQSDRKHYQ